MQPEVKVIVFSQLRAVILNLEATIDLWQAAWIGMDRFSDIYMNEVTEWTFQSI